VAWIIDKDYVAEGNEKSAVGVMGPRIYTGDGTELKKRFRMLDDDGRLYYEGRSDTDDDENALGPLDDFGTPYAGATIIQYWVAGRGGGWRNLN